MFVMVRCYCYTSVTCIVWLGTNLFKKILKNKDEEIQSNKNEKYKEFLTNYFDDEVFQWMSDSF